MKWIHQWPGSIKLLWVFGFYDWYFSAFQRASCNLSADLVHWVWLELEILSLSFLVFILFDAISMPAFIILFRRHCTFQRGEGVGLLTYQWNGRAVSFVLFFSWVCVWIHTFQFKMPFSISWGRDCAVHLLLFFISHYRLEWFCFSFKLVLLRHFQTWFY